MVLRELINMFKEEFQPEVDILKSLAQRFCHPTAEENQNLKDSNQSSNDKSHHLGNYRITETYIERIQQIGDASAMLGLNGVYLFLQKLSQNVYQLRELDLESRKMVYDFFVNWIEPFNDYLDSIGTEKCFDNAMKLVNHLSEPPALLEMSEEESIKFIEELIAEPKLSENLEQELAAAEINAYKISVEDVNIDVEDKENSIFLSFMAEVPHNLNNLTTLIEAINDIVDRNKSNVSNGDYSEESNLIEYLKEAKRLAHTIKGSAQISRIRGIASITHKVEDILEFFEKNPRSTNTTLCKLTQASIDCVGQMIDFLEGRDEQPLNSFNLLSQLVEFIKKINIGEFDVEFIEPQQMVATIPSIVPRVEINNKDGLITHNIAYKKFGDDSGTDKKSLKNNTTPNNNKTTDEQKTDNSKADKLKEQEKIDKLKDAKEKTEANLSKPPDKLKGIEIQEFRISAKVIDSVFRLVDDSKIKIEKLREVARDSITTHSTLVRENQNLTKKINELETLIHLVEATQNKTINKNLKFRENSNNTNSISKDNQKEKDTNYHRDSKSNLGNEDNDSTNLTTNLTNNDKRKNKAQKTESEFDELELHKYSDVYSYMRGIVEVSEDIRALSRQLDSHFNSMLQDFDDINNEQKEIAHLVLSSKMTSVKSLNQRFSRVVRQAASTTQKNVNFNLIGEDTLVDSEVLNRLTDPLMHILRNSVDHGLEEAEERIQKGKTPDGSITLTFAKQGSNIVITCLDDGRGLNYEAILNKAKKLELIDNMAKPSEKELAQIILLPGFSTREQVSELSGRGVGMDVVKTQVSLMGGIIDIYSETGRGCKIEIKIRASLLTAHVLLVQHGGILYAIPTTNIIKMIDSNSGQTNLFNEQYNFEIDGKMYQHYWLHDLTQEYFDLEDYKAKQKEMNRSMTFLSEQDNDKNIHMPTIILQTGKGEIAISVEKLITTKEIIIQPLNYLSNNISWISGGTIIGNGEVAPILDLISLIEKSGGVRQANNGINLQKIEELKTAKKQTKILVVDDSLSARNFLTELVKDLGYMVDTAKDGLDAIHKISKFKPDMVLTDLEMPEMNGIELSMHIRGDNKIKDLPIIMITSRATEKYVNHAKSIGINAFFAKPYNEVDLSKKIRELLVASKHVHVH